MPSRQVKPLVRAIYKILIFLLFFTVVLLIFAEVHFQVSPLAVSQYLTAQVGSAIGVTVGVLPNPFNTLTQQLREKESTLEEREKILQQKEAAEGKNKPDKTPLYLFGAGGVLLTLILFNFYLDYRRRKV